MKHNFGEARFVVMLSVALILIVGTVGVSSASALEESVNPMGSRSQVSFGLPCATNQQIQALSKPDITGLASRTICSLYNDTVTTAQSLVSGSFVLQNLPWAPMLVVLVLFGFLALSGWCAWKMKDYRPRKKYHIGRTI
jgi:hypothetical protein